MLMMLYACICWKDHYFRIVIYFFSTGHSHPRRWSNFESYALHTQLIITLMIGFAFGCRAAEQIFEIVRFLSLVRIIFGGNFDEWCCLLFGSRVFGEWNYQWNGFEVFRVNLTDLFRLKLKRNVVKKFGYF
jgi:hypothetical protein